MQGGKGSWGTRKLWIGGATVFSAVVLLSAVATNEIATGLGEDELALSFIGERHISEGGSRDDRQQVGGGDDGNPHHETVPCTGPKEPINFEVFSAGPAPAGLSLTGTSRRCDIGVPAHGWPNNYVNYSYGSCEIPEGAIGCAPPLTIQTWPACQRSKADYSFEEKPLPYRKLPQFGRAEVLEFTFPAERIEVYTKSATVVIFATDQDLARKAVRLLRPQEKEKRPATDADALRGKPQKGLPPPSDGSMKGALACGS